jgi:heavy metal sensor kinase
MKWIRTIRFRFALWATLLLLGMLVAFGTFVYFNLSHSLRTAVDETLSLTVSQTAAGLNVENERIIIPEQISLEESGFQAFSEHGLTLIVLAQDGSILEAAGPYHFHPAPVTGAVNQGIFTTLPESGETDPIRVYTLPVLDNNQVVGWVQAMQSLEGVQDSLNRLLVALLLGSGLLFLVTAFAGYFLAARALAPIDRITQTARRISTEDLSARLNLPDTGDEVSRLAATFDSMLARIEHGFQRERQFTSDASHELRTPLTAMQAILSLVSEGERPVDEYRQALDDLSGEADRLRGLVEGLLQLARGDQPGARLRERVDLSTLLCDVADSLRPLADAKGLSLIGDVSPGLALMGDSDSLIRLFVNLLDNAIKFTEQGAVTVTGRRVGNRLTVEIADTGPGIAPEHLSRIFDRFYRVETARSSAGTGLGLAIARQIVQAHGGEITAESKVGIGTRISVLLPASER